jgi:8-oxo-dGTP diphosphatase
MAGFLSDRIVSCRDHRDVRFLPGGTREVGESIDDCVRRELEEGAGVAVAGALVALALQLRSAGPLTG